MTAPPIADRVPPGPPRLELVSIGWRRIQALVTVRAVGTRLDPDRLRLRHDGTGETTPIAGVDVDADLAVVRVNVMQGPRRRPLDDGRWWLVEADGAGGLSPMRLVPPGAPATLRASAEFSIWRSGQYAATVSLDEPSGSLAIDVSLDTSRVVDGRWDESVAPVRPKGRVAHLVARSRIYAFRVAYRVLRPIARRNGRRVLFSSDSRGELGGNLRFVYDRMLERGLDREFELLTLFKEGITSRRSLGDRLRLPWMLARADVVVIDDYQPIIYRVDDPHWSVVQLWHAVGAFKTVGYSRVGKPGAPDPYGRVHKSYRWVTVSSRADIPVYAEAFGIPESHVVATGIPRVDPMFDPAHRDASLVAVQAAYPQTAGREVILFAPTFRGDGARSAWFDLSRIDYARLHAVCQERDAVCLVRLHPFVRMPLGIPEACRDRIVDASVTRHAVETNDLLFAVDLLITDYSSIVYEYSTLGRPMLFYAWDLDEYIASRDFYEPYETFVPGRIVRTFDELLDAIRRGDCMQEKVEPFARRHFDHLDGGSTDRVVDLITRR